MFGKHFKVMYSTAKCLCKSGLNQYQSLDILETSWFGLPSKLLSECKGIEM